MERGGNKWVFIQGKWGHWALNYIGTQCIINTIFYSLSKTMGTLIKCLIFNFSTNIFKFMIGVILFFFIIRDVYLFIVHCLLRSLKIPGCYLSGKFAMVLYQANFVCKNKPLPRGINRQFEYLY